MLVFGSSIVLLCFSCFAVRLYLLKTFFLTRLTAFQPRQLPSPPSSSFPKWVDLIWRGFRWCKGLKQPMSRGVSYALIHGQNKKYVTHLDLYKICMNIYVTCCIHGVEPQGIFWLRHVNKSLMSFVNPKWAEELETWDTPGSVSHLLGPELSAFHETRLASAWHWVAAGHGSFARPAMLLQRSEQKKEIPGGLIMLSLVGCFSWAVLILWIVDHGTNFTVCHFVTLTSKIKHKTFHRKASGKKKNRTTMLLNLFDPFCFYFVCFLFLRVPSMSTAPRNHPKMPPSRRPLTVTCILASFGAPAKESCR